MNNADHLRQGPENAPREAVQAAVFALYSLHDLLVAKGLLEPGEAAANLRRYTCDDAVLMGYLEGIALNLDDMPFKPWAPPALRLVELSEHSGGTPPRT